MKYRSKISWGLALALGLGLSACSLTPEYKAPDVAIPEHFKEDMQRWEQANPQQPVDSGTWWQVFHDERLDALIREGTANNLQLASAKARLGQAMATLGVAGANLYPTLGISAGTTDNRQSDNRPLRNASQPSFYDDNHVAAVASYEVDFFGKNSASVEAARALAGAAEQDAELVKLIVAADIATTYFYVLDLDGQLDIVRQTIAGYERQADIIQRRFDQGVVAGADLYRAKSVVELERLHESSLQTQRSQYEHALAFLIGKTPSQFSLPHGSNQSESMPAVPLGLPSQLLQRRPDIAAAERRVAASNAEIGVAKAAFFPAVTLSAFIGWENASTDPLINAPNLFWSIGPQLFFTLFDAGRRDALEDFADQRHQETIASYKLTVLSAIREVEDLLVDLGNREQSQPNLDRAADLLKKLEATALRRYDEGISSYLEVADASLQYLQAQLAVNNQRTQMLIGRVALIKALGGYWNGASRPGAAAVQGSVAAPPPTTRAPS